MTTDPVAASQSQVPFTPGLQAGLAQHTGPRRRGDGALGARPEQSLIALPGSAPRPPPLGPPAASRPALSVARYVFYHLIHCLLIW